MFSPTNITNIKFNCISLRVCIYYNIISVVFMCHLRSINGSYVQHQSEILRYEFEILFLKYKYCSAQPSIFTPQCSKHIMIWVGSWQLAVGSWQLAGGTKGQKVDTALMSKYWDILPTGLKPDGRDWRNSFSDREEWTL